MTTAYSTKGRTVGFKQQTSLGDAPTTGFGDVRLEEPVSIPTVEKMAVKQPNLGHVNALNWDDQPITYESVQADALTLPLTFRQGDSAGVNSPISEFAESGGCGLEVSTDDTIATATDAANYTGTAGIFTGDQYALCTTIELPDGRYYPTLINTYTTSTDAIKLQMATPAAGAVAADLQATETIFGKTGEVTASKLQSFLTQTRDATAAFYNRGCALSSFGEIVIEPGAAEGGIVKVNPTFHVADVERVTDTLDPTETFRDHSKVGHIANNLVCEFGDYSQGGEIAHSNLELLKATISLNHSTVPIPGIGSTSTLNDIQGYMAQMTEQPTVVLEVLMDKDYWDDFTNDQTEKHIGFVLPSTSIDSVAWGIWFPKCYQTTSPVADLHGSEYIKATLTYSATSADLVSGISTNNNSFSSPWYVAIMQR